MNVGFFSTFCCVKNVLIELIKIIRFADKKQLFIKYTIKTLIDWTDGSAYEKLYPDMKKVKLGGKRYFIYKFSKSSSVSGLKD